MSQAKVLILMGAGFSGSTFAANYRADSVMIAIDPDKFSEHHSILACASGMEGFKVDAVASYRKLHHLGKTIGIPLRLESLGNGFWRWASTQGAVVVDCTDGDEASFEFSHRLAIRHRLTVVMSKIHRNFGFVRVFPGKSAIGFCCLGFRSSTARASCLGINADDVPSTNASLSIASCLAGIMMGAIGSIGEKAYEVRVDLDRLEFMRSLLNVQPCQHRIPDKADERIVLNGAYSTETTLEELMSEAQRHLGRCVRLNLEFPMVDMIKCTNCGAVVAGGWQCFGAKTYQCHKCGGLNMKIEPKSMWSGHIITSEQMRENNIGSVNLMEFGMPYWEIYRFENSEGRTLDIELNDQTLVGCGL